VRRHVRIDVDARNPTSVWAYNDKGGELYGIEQVTNCAETPEETATELAVFRSSAMVRGVAFNGLHLTPLGDGLFSSSCVSPASVLADSQPSFSCNASIQVFVA
jgi:hypothetical protein